ncbi:MAG: heme-copper oxidase subunit III [Anaerolineales bacterium]
MSMELGRKRYPAPAELPLNANDPRAPLWWGMIGLITIEAVFFISLIVSYFYLRFYAPEWPLGGISKPDLLLPSIAAVILFVSSAPMYWADSSIKKGNVRNLKVGLALSFVLGAVFLALKAVEYSAYDYNWATNAYGSITWTIAGFHSAHVITVLLKVAVVFTAAARGYFSEDRNLGVRINGLYWHFVVVVWVPLFFTLYLSHYVF